MYVGQLIGIRGLDAHSAERYLSSKAAGKAVLEVLPEFGR
jgi:hypothetical protein